MLSPDERQKVEATAIRQWGDDLALKLGLSLELMPTLAPWFNTSKGRPIWLTPDDRVFLKSLKISDQ